MYRVIGITNRHLCRGDYEKQIEKIAALSLEAVILREKDLPEEQYRELAKKVMKICRDKGRKCILHNFYETAEELGAESIHLPLTILKENPELIHHFKEIGVSTHSVEQALEAESLGAAYITAGHIFATDCKKGLEPRGLKFLQQVCDSVRIPVYAIGGIHKDNIKSTIMCGAAGVCVMSGMMKYQG